MLSSEELNLIFTLMNKENFLEIVREVNSTFGQLHPDKIEELLTINNSLISAKVKSLNNDNCRKEQAIHWVVCDLATKKNFAINNNGSFIVALNACKELFPNAKKEHGSEASNKYFDAMKEYFLSHKEEYLDSDWAITYGHNNYLKGLLED